MKKASLLCALLLAGCAPSAVTPSASPATAQPEVIDAEEEFYEHFPQESIVAQAIENDGVDIALTASLRFRSGVLATVNCSFIGDSVELTEITGSTGTLVIRDTFFDSDLPILLYRGEEETVYSIPSCNRYKEELESFSNCILDDTAVPISIDESLRNNRLIKEILEASKK